MPSLAERFVAPLEGEKVVFNAGSQLLVGLLAPDSDEPLVHTLTVATNASSGAATLSLTSDRTSTRLRKSSVLRFGSVSAVVTADTEVTGTATSVPVEPLSANIAANATATTWALLRVLSTTNLPITLNDTMVNRTDHAYGLQGSEAKTKQTLSVQVTLINDPGDRAFHDIIWGAATGGSRIFAHIARNGGRHAWGPSMVSSASDDGNIEEISRPSITLNYQAPFATPKLFPYLSTDEKTWFNTARRLSGLTVLS
jgi:hypothetical protein